MNLAHQNISTHQMVFKPGFVCFFVRIACSQTPIQEAGNEKLHRVGTPSTLELVLITPF
jgi:hypothetical protein